MTSGRKPPKAVVFDVLGTLIPLDGLRQTLKKAGLPEDKADAWYYLCHRDGIMTTMTGRFVTFKEIASYHAQGVFHEAGITYSPESQAEFWKALTTTPAFGDVGPGIKRLAEIGVLPCSLTNGATPVTMMMYESLGVMDIIDPKLQWQVADAGAWKPDKRAYDHAAKVLKEEHGIERDEVMMVSKHLWDVHGAKLAGLQAAFMCRICEPYPTWVEQPDVQATSLMHLAELLAAEHGKA